MVDFKECSVYSAYDGSNQHFSNCWDSGRVHNEYQKFTSTMTDRKKIAHCNAVISPAANWLEKYCKQFAEYTDTG